MTVRATKRGAERTSLDGTRVDVLICGASFAGLAAARELAGSGAEVLLLDRYAIGERQTSACACPRPWMEEMGVEASIRQELPFMSFTTPHGTARYRLPWTWSAFDYRELCDLLWAQCDGVRFETATVAGPAERDPHGDLAVPTDRGVVRAPLVLDALGWRRVLAGSGVQPPAAPLTRALEVHPPHDGTGDALDLWIERPTVRRGYAWRVPAGREARIGVASYDPSEHVRAPVGEHVARLGGEPVGFQGNWVPHRLRAAVEDGVFFAGDSAGHCFPLSAEGIRTAFYFGCAAGRQLRSVVEGHVERDAALAAYAAFSARHARAFRVAAALQRLIPALPPRVLTRVLRVIGRQWLVDRSFGWYLRQAHPAGLPQRDSRLAA
ncbi:unannotated protein [freshwater metagenome]|uniref:Unannotated protein n=1 Tax=freshwater metagenome TaxID=449393 RepID=A0A6J7IHK1_9ZZZZ|nr:NAD(P)/FAD-dependent oxidoreductase [Actinomycetota bacterium]